MLIGEEDATIDPFLGHFIPEAGVIEERVLNVGLLEAEARVQAQYMYIGGPYIAEGDKRAQFMNTMEE